MMFSQSTRSSRSEQPDWLVNASEARPPQFVRKRCERCSEMMHYADPSDRAHTYCQPQACTRCARVEIIPYGYDTCERCRVELFGTPDTSFEALMAAAEDGRMNSRYFVCKGCSRAKSRASDLKLLEDKGYRPKFYGPQGAHGPLCDTCFVDGVTR